MAKIRGIRQMIKIEIILGDFSLLRSIPSIWTN